MPRRYPAEFRRKVLDLVAAGRPVAQVAGDLQISAQVIYTWRRQQLVDSGQLPGMTSTDHAELVAARKRIAELEAELAVHRRTAELLGHVVLPKTVRGDRRDGRRAAAGPAGHPRAGRLGVGVPRVARPGTVRAGGPTRVADRADPSHPPRFAGRLRVPAGACRAHPGPAYRRRSQRGGDADAPRWDQKGLPGSRRARPRHQTPTAVTWSTGSSPARSRTSGITEHPTREGKVYCAVVLDAYSRRVVGWSIDSTQTAALVTSALDMAIRNRTAELGVVIHSDHGAQYTSWAFTDRARTSGLLPSMGSIGDCYDDAMIESFWGRVQTELLNRQRWRTRLELANALFEYLEIFHNRRRRHSGWACSPRPNTSSASTQGP